MDYSYIESLVLKSKQNDKFSKKLLAEEFRPFIINITKRTFIHGYDTADIINECYRILFYCLKLYKPASHRFVAYATNGIKNSINDLIEKHRKRSSCEGNEALILSDKLEHVLLNEDECIEEKLCTECDYNTVKIVINELQPLERELVTFVYLNKKTVREFSKVKNITYNSAIALKNSALNNMFVRLKYFYKI